MVSTPEISFTAESILLSMDGPRESDYRIHVTACRRAVAACERCLREMAKERARPDPVAELWRSCAKICGLAVQEMTHNSGFVAQVCGLGAVVCRACAEECSERAGPAYRACRTACERAARACCEAAMCASAGARRRGDSGRERRD